MLGLQVRLCNGIQLKWFLTNWVSSHSFVCFIIIWKSILLVSAHQDNVLLHMVWQLPLLRLINHLGMWNLPTRNFYQMCDLFMITLLNSILWSWNNHNQLCWLWKASLFKVGCILLRRKRLEQAGKCFIKHSSQSEACSLLYAYVQCRREPSALAKSELALQTTTIPSFTNGCKIHGEPWKFILG